MTPSASGPTGLAGEIILADCSDQTKPRKYKLARDQNGRPVYSEAAHTLSGLDVGRPLSKKWEYFPGGCGFERDVEEAGGYHFGRNIYPGRPGRVLPAPQRNDLTLTGNTVPVTQFFEAASQSDEKYLYALAGTKVFKISLTEMALRNVREMNEATVQFKTGTYPGTGATNPITGVGFKPDGVIIRPVPSGPAVISVTGMPSGWGKSWHGGGTTNDRIMSFDNDGFTVGSNSAVNYSGYTYYFTCWKNAAGYIKVGTYDGDAGATKAITGVGFLPELLWVWCDTQTEPTYEIMSKHSTHGTNESVGYESANTSTNCIRTLDADGFTVGNDVRVNGSGKTFRYVAFRKIGVGQEYLTVGTYTGNGADARQLGDADLTPDVEYTPEWVIVSRYGTSTSVHRSDKASGDATTRFEDGAQLTDHIESLVADGFVVGTNARVNLNTVVYHFAAFRSLTSMVPVFGPPALWNGYHELPCGMLHAWHQLTTITDDTSNDTWTERTGFYSQGFCVVENELLRWRDDRKMDKTSSTDPTTGYTGTYYVGIPGEVIRGVLAAGAEACVLTDRNVYLFDRVAVARPQLDVAKVNPHVDNGKGAFQWTTWSLLPYGDLYRLSPEGILPIGIDQFPLNQPAPNIDYEPRFGRYGGVYAIGGWIYAVYGRKTATGTYIKYGRPAENKWGVVWDTLYHTTGIASPTILFIDSDHRLWWDNGNNLSWYQLGEDGSPESTAFGNASSNDYFFLGETDLGAGGDLFQLREVTVQIANGSANCSWAVYVSIDGGVPAQVGASWTTETPKRLHWTPGTADSGRRARFYVARTYNGSYSPGATPPELLSLQVDAIGLPEVGATVEMSLLLAEGDNRTPKQRYDDLFDALKGGVYKFRNPILNEDQYVNVVGLAPQILWQSDSDVPVVAAAVRLERATYTG